MPTTLKDALESLKSLPAPLGKPVKKISDRLLGKYEGVVPAGKTSTELIKELRKTMYGKVGG